MAHRARTARSGRRSRPGVSLIAEHKRRSPSAGQIRDGATVSTSSAPTSAAARPRCRSSPRAPLRRLARRPAGGARGTDLPILRKDFIVDPYQVYETAAAGADAMLLIVAALDDDDLAALHREARGLDLDVLVEVHDEDELERALEVVDADVIGINNRDLDRLLGRPRAHLRAARRRARRQDRRRRVGLPHPRAARRLERVGVDAVLVGETLMRAPDPEAACRELAGPTWTRC